MALLITAGCGQGKLSRENALALLRQSGQHYLGALSFTMHTSIGVPYSEDGKEASLLAIEFLDELSRQGVLRRPQVKEGGGWLDPRTRYRYYYYSLPNPDVEQEVFVTIDQRITYSRSYFMEVTGISQEGNVAEAEVLLGQEFTPIFKTIMATLESLKDKGKDLRANKAVMLELFSPYQVITEPSPGPVSRIRVDFKRYDDGWRVEP